MGDLERVLEDFKLCDIETYVWDAFSEAESKFVLDLGLDVTYVTPPMLKLLTKALTKCDAESWTHLRMRTDHLSIVEALLCVFGQLCAHGPDDQRTALACKAYLTFLCIPKADSLWSLVFRPVLMRRVIKLLVITLKIAKKGQDDENVGDVNVGAWLSVLGHLEELLQRFRLANSFDGIQPTIEELVLIAASPVDSHRDAVAPRVYNCLYNMLDKSSDRVVVASVMFKLILPTIIMTQREHLSSIPKALLQLKDAAIAFVQKCCQDFPELLERIERVNEDDEDEDKEENADADAAKPPQEKAGPKPEENVDAPEDADGDVEMVDANEVAAASNPENGNNAEPDGALNPVGDDAAAPAKKRPAITILDPLVALCEHICIQVPERAEWRVAAAATIVQFQSNHAACLERFVTFLGSLLHCETANRRVIAAEVTVAVLGLEVPTWPLLASIVDRTVDLAPTVRSKALIGMALAVKGLSEEQQAKVFQQHSEHFVNFRAIFMLRAQDEKAGVRRAALTFWDSIVEIGLRNGFEIAPAIDMISSLTGDDSVLVRKGALHSISFLLKLAPREDVYKAWSNSVLASIVDAERSVAEKALEEVQTHVLNRLQDFVKLASKTLDLPVFHLMKVFDEDATEYLQRGLSLLRKKCDGALPKPLCKALDEIVRYCLANEQPRDWPITIWSLLEEAVAYEPDILSPTLAVDCYEFLRESHSDIHLLTAKTLNLVSQVTTQVDDARKAQLMDHLLTDLLEFNAQCFIIKSMMTTLAGVATDKLFINQLLKTIYNNLGAYIDPLCALELPSKMLERYIFTLGEIALMDETRVSHWLMAALRKIATGHVYTLVDGDQRLRGVSPAVRGQAFIAIGKLCLRREELAKGSVELIVLHLMPGHPHIIRNNVLIVLCDLAMKYTSLVDRFVPMMADVLRDKQVLLRKQAAMIISSLLAEEYIKFKGTCMLRFLYAISDTCVEIRHFIESVFSRILVPRNPQIFANNFVDFICSLNNWTALPNYQGAVGNESFSLQKFPNRRAMIYRFMLSKMTNEQKFTVVGSIVKDILAAFIETDEFSVPFPIGAEDAGTHVMTDCLALLGCKEMKVCFSKDAKVNEDEVAKNDNAAEDAKLRTQLLSQVMKRNMCDNVVPTLVELRSTMEKRSSPYLKQMDVCLREVVIDYRSDLSAIMGGDSQVIKEMEFDMAEQSKNKKQHRGRPSLLRMIVPLDDMRPPTTPCSVKSKDGKRMSISSLPRFARAGVQAPPILQSTVARRQRHSTPGRMTPRRSCSQSTHLLTPTGQNTRVRQSMPGRVSDLTESFEDALQGLRASLPESRVTEGSSEVNNAGDGADSVQRKRARDVEGDNAEGEVGSTGERHFLEKFASPPKKLLRFSNPDNTNDANTV
eukprot:GEMP01000402.1.p1 GENE.GEMP01000402.1~~GEMP01000402.1.p1  ORF type:complete len:1384 (+),score=336.58 GEMP01000402.1:128-4279(+)